MNADADILEAALEAERVRNAQQIATVRLMGVAAVFLINSAFLMRTSYTGAPSGLLGAYCLVALLLWWGQKRVEGLARWGGLAIAFIDMPAIFVLVSSVIAQLLESGFTDDAAAVATQASLFYLTFIWLASMTLQTPYTWLAGGIAISLQTVLFVMGGRDSSFIVMVDIGTVVGTYLCLYIRKRSVALVSTAAVEQSQRERLGRYFSPAVAEAVVNAEADFTKGQSREVTVVFADIRDFTALTETLSSDRVVGVLNDFHTRMVDCIFKHGGTLDKYMGDGLMAYFGAPVDQPDHAERAVVCALDMQHALDDLNRDLERRGMPPLRMGVGIHSGTVVLGDIGAARRREFTIIGDTVNVAARVEQLTKTCGASILVTEETRRRVDRDLGFAAVEPLAVKGKSRPLQTYRVEAGADRQSLKRGSSE